MAPRPYVIVAGITLVVVAFVGYKTVLNTVVDKDIAGAVGTENDIRKIFNDTQEGQRADVNKADSQASARESDADGPSAQGAHQQTAPQPLVADKTKVSAPEGNKGINPSGNSADTPAPEGEIKTTVATVTPPKTDLWTPPAVPEEVAHVDQTDPQLAKHIRDKWILPPFTGPRNLAHPETIHYSQRAQSQYIDGLLKQRTNGFYIECGAATGEPLSNSLFFEKSRNWTGILIEGNTNYFKNILNIKRHAYMMNACLSPGKNPEVLDFRMAGYIGGLIEHMEPGHKARVVHENGEEAPVKIQCFPLLAILRALNVTHVDYFSLDIEGAEYEIMKDFPFDEIQVDVLTIEYVVSGGGSATQEKLKKIKDLMIGRYGYKQETSYPGYEDIMLSKGV